MECERALEWMMQTLDGEPDPAGQAALEDHLSRCTDCRVEWERLQALEQLLRQDPMVQPPAGFAGRVMAHLDRRRRVRRVALGGLALGLGTVVAVGLLIGPSLALLPSLPSELAALFEAGKVLLPCLGEAALTFLNSLWVTASALIVPAVPLALCGLILALTANLVWLGLIRRLQRAPTIYAST